MSPGPGSSRAPRSAAVNGLTRRDFVAAVLGAPAAWAACEEQSRTLPDGELLTPGKALGHRLRDEPPSPSEPVSRWESADVVVVGAGAAGLSAAWWLRKQGVKSCVTLDLDGAVGGTARAGHNSITAFPWGAHYIVEPTVRQPELLQLLDELGALEPRMPTKVAEHVRCRDPAERVFFRGRWYPGLYLHAGATEEDARQLLRFRREIDAWVRFRDAQGRRAFDLPLCRASDENEVRELDRMSFAAWLDAKGLTSERLRWLTNYSCRDDYGLTETETSAWAGIAYYAARMEAPGSEARPVVTWPAGNGHLAAHLAQSTQLRLEHAVYDVRELAEGGRPKEVPAQRGEGASAEGASADGARVEVRALTPEGLVGFRAQAVIVATPLALARRIVAPLRAGVRPVPLVDKGAWAVVNLSLRARPEEGRGAPLSWDNVLRDSASLGYVVATHQTGADHGESVFTWYYPFTGSAPEARKALDGAGREEWVSAALSDLGRAHPDIWQLCTRADVAYWGHAMPRPLVGKAFEPALRAAVEPLGRIHFAHTELSAVALFEEAFEHGVRAARDVLPSLELRI